MRLPAGRKLGQRWLGLFVIVGRVGPVAYRLGLPETLHIHPVFHASWLREYRDPGDSREPGGPILIVVDRSLEWEAERILHHQCVGHGK